MRLLCLLVLLGRAFAQEPPAWFPKAPPLPAPAGKVVRANSADAIVTEAENLSEGATLLIEPGEYLIPRPIVLRARKQIAIRSAAGDPASVTLKGKGWEAGNQFDDIVHVADCNGVLIAGLTFAECRSYGIKVEAENAPRDVNLYNCRFRNIGVRAIKGSAGKDPNVRATGGTVRFCDFENTKTPPSDWLYGGDYIAAIDMMALDGWRFSDNTFRNIKGRNGGGRAAIFIWVRSRQIVVERNLMVNCDRGISFGNPGVSTANRPGEEETYVSAGIIQNNMISGGADCGIELWHVEGIQVRHNSIVRPEQNFGRGIRIGAGARRVEVVNNLVHGGISKEGSEANIHDNVAQRLGLVFTDASRGDLSLLPGAAQAIGRAVPLADVITDIRGQRRKNSPDLGAWETTR